MKIKKNHQLIIFLQPSLYFVYRNFLNYYYIGLNHIYYLLMFSLCVCVVIIEQNKHFDDYNRTNEYNIRYLLYT